MKKLLALGTCLSILGCASAAPIPVDAQKVFTYDFEIEGKTQAELWKTAREFFAGIYGDSRAVFQTQDPQEGTLIGKGNAHWTIAGSDLECVNDYNIRYAAKSGKARLQFELINEVPATSHCPAWPLPSKVGYKQITEQFKKVSDALGQTLSADSGKDWKDF